MAEHPAAATAAPHSQRRHPPGIYLIFSTEIWERFSYYGMRGLLVLFLTSATIEGGFGWEPSRALELYALYTSVVYLTPIVGGYLGDRFLGRRLAVIVGSALMMAGHFTMVLPGLAPLVAESVTGFPVGDVLQGAGVAFGSLTVPDHALGAWRAHASTVGHTAVPEFWLEWTYAVVSWSFYLALLLIVAGTGFFKSNMATMVGELYAEGDQRRDAGYTIYYTGANIGAFLANLVAGTIGEIYGWHFGFSVAGVGMAVGLAVFLWQAPRLMAGIGEPQAHIEAYRRPFTARERGRIKGVLLMSLFTIVFWMGFEQGGGLLNLMVRDTVDRSVMGAEVPVTWFQSLNPMFIFLFAPLFVAFWGRLERRGRPMHPTTKYALGLGMMGASYLVMLGALWEVSVSGYCSPLWLVAVFAIQTAGELTISPVSKALVSRYAPPQVASPMMGAEFACYAIGAWLAGQLGAWAMDSSAQQVFLVLTGACFAAALVCVSLRRRIDSLLG